MTTDKPYCEQDIVDCLRVAAEAVGHHSYYLRAASVGASSRHHTGEHPMSEFKFPRPDQYVLVRVKREWVPDWLYSFYSAVFPTWLEPFRWIVHREVDDDAAQ